MRSVRARVARWLIGRAPHCDWCPFAACLICGHRYMHTDQMELELEEK